MNIYSKCNPTLMVTGIGSLLGGFTGGVVTGCCVNAFNFTDACIVTCFGGFIGADAGVITALTVDSFHDLIHQ